ncbi:hypothetical protein BGY98DRAFT_1096224 [Russula aff. rugulosa BPL654]|nr:hypothetical protein BGY98DRAFT_1096224 [Russula aff. rugulosa BPL654]
MLTVVRMIGIDVGLSMQIVAVKVKCIDHLDKADAPLILEVYNWYSFLLYNTLAIQKPPTGSIESVHAPGGLGQLDPMTLRDQASPHLAANYAYSAEHRPARTPQGLKPYEESVDIR